MQDFVLKKNYIATSLLILIHLDQCLPQEFLCFGVLILLSSLINRFPTGQPIAVKLTDYNANDTTPQQTAALANLQICPQT